MRKKQQQVVVFLTSSTQLQIQLWAKNQCSPNISTDQDQFFITTHVTHLWSFPNKYRLNTWLLSLPALGFCIYTHTRYVRQSLSIKSAGKKMAVRGRRFLSSYSNTSIPPTRCFFFFFLFKVRESLTPTTGITLDVKWLPIMLPTHIRNEAKAAQGRCII